MIENLSSKIDSLPGKSSREIEGRTGGTSLANVASTSRIEESNEMTRVESHYNYVSCLFSVFFVFLLGHAFCFPILSIL